MPGPHVEPQGGGAGRVRRRRRRRRGLWFLLCRRRFRIRGSSSGGPWVTRIFAAPVNYRDAQGAWQPISNQLVADPTGGFKNQANGFSLHVPASLSSPVSVSSGGRSLSFTLEGASALPAAAASVSGDDATFAGALASTDLTYHSRSDGVSELVRLGDSSAPESLRFDLAASAGLTAEQLADGTVELADAGGAVRFSIPPSVAYRPGAGAGPPRVLSSTLSQSGSGWVLSVDTSAAWLRSVRALVAPPNANAPGGQRPSLASRRSGHGAIAAALDA